MQISYINTDLDLTSASDLSPLVSEFGNQVVVLHHGPVGEVNHLSCELMLIGADINDTAGCESVDDTVGRFCSLIENLSAEARRVWNCCQTRVVDIAFESGTNPTSYSSPLRAETVRRLAALNVGIVVTIYPVGAYADTKANS